MTDPTPAERVADEIVVMVGLPRTHDERNGAGLDVAARLAPLLEAVAEVLRSGFDPTAQGGPCHYVDKWDMDVLRDAYADLTETR